MKQTKSLKKTQKIQKNAFLKNVFKKKTLIII